MPTPSLLDRRWLITFDHDGRERVTPIDPERFFLKMEELPDLIRDPGFMIDGKLLVEVVHACADRIAGKLAGRAHRVAAYFAERDRSFRVIVTGGEMLHG